MWLSGFEPLAFRSNNLRANSSATLPWDESCCGNSYGVLKLSGSPEIFFPCPLWSFLLSHVFSDGQHRFGGCMVLSTGCCVIFSLGTFKHFLMIFCMRFYSITASQVCFAFHVVKKEHFLVSPFLFLSFSHLRLYLLLSSFSSSPRLFCTCLLAG